MDFFYNLSIEELRLIVLIAVGAFVVAFIFEFFIRWKLKNERKAMGLLISILGEETMQEVDEYLKEQKDGQKDLESGPIAEYNRLVDEIHQKYAPEIKEITDYYNAEINRVRSEYSALRAEANRLGNVSAMSQYQQMSSSETMALGRKRDAQLAPIKAAQSRELAQLKNEFKGDLDLYRDVKKYNKKIVNLTKSLNNAKKYKISVPTFEE